MQTRSLLAVLACAGGTVRVLDGADLEAHCRQSKAQPPPRHELRIPSVPTTLHLAANDGGESGQNVLFGTDDGRVGVVTVTRWVKLVGGESHPKFTFQFYYKFETDIFLNIR